MTTHTAHAPAGPLPPARKIFTNRRGGVSAGAYASFNLGDHVGDDAEAVAANRARLAQILGVPTMVYMEQRHTATVTEVTAAHVADRREVQVEMTDALVTTLREVALVVLTADCVPVLLSDDDAGIIAAIHAGRLGARNGIVARTVDRMLELGAAAQNIHALIGAAASGERYEVPDDMARDVESRLPGSSVRTLQGTAGVDIRAGISRQLRQRGVRTIDVDPRCTIADEDFFSYRRDGVTGRQAGVVWLPAAEPAGERG